LWVELFDPTSQSSDETGTSHKRAFLFNIRINNTQLWIDKSQWWEYGMKGGREKIETDRHKKRTVRKKRKKRKKKWEKET